MYNRTDEISELIKALCLAKKDFKPISKDGKNPFLNSKYVTLDGIVNATEDALNENGLVIIHHQELTLEDTFLVTELIHESGQIIGTETGMNQYIGPVSLNEKGNMKVNPLQVFGSVITYLKRYHISELLNVAVDEDIDGNDTADKKQSKGTAETKPKDETQSDFPSTIEGVKELLAGIDNAVHMKNWIAKHGKDINMLGNKSEIWTVVKNREKELEATPAGTKTPEETKDDPNDALFAGVKALIDLQATTETLDSWVSINAEKIVQSSNKDRINEYISVRQHEIEELDKLANLGNGDKDANNQQ